jgi:hypothetical protein
MTGRGRGRGGRGRGRGQNYSSTGAATAKHRELCSALESHVFDYGQKAAAGDQMRITWEKIVNHVGTIYGHDISNELLNKKYVSIPEPEYTQETLVKHVIREARVRSQQQRLQTARRAHKSALKKAILAEDVDATIKLAILENEIEEATYQETVELPIKMDELEKTHYDNEWRTFRERNSRLEKQRGQAFLMIRGQCMQVLLDKMKHDPDWTSTSESYDPLTLFKLIENTILAQTEDQYPFATVYEQESSIYSLDQHSLTNEQWYERFNTKIDVGSAIGVTRQHRVLLEHVAAENGGATPFDELNEDEQKDVREKAEERYLSYVFLRQSEKQHAKLKTDLQNDFTTGDDRYPKNRQSTLHLLDKYSKSAPAIHTPSEGTAFTQKGGREGNRDKETFNAKYWKDKDCYNCNKQGHPSSHCPEKKKKAKPPVAKQNDDDTSQSSKSSKASITKMHKKIKKSFATLQSKIDEMDEDSELSSSDSDDDEQSHFQFSGNKITRMPTENGIALQQTFAKRNAAVLLKQSDGKPSRLDLRNIILLDSQSTMDLFGNKSLVTNITTANNKM